MTNDGRIQYCVDTAGGTYLIHIPSGRSAIRHFTLMRKASPKKYDEDGNPVIDKNDEKDMDDAMEQWCMFVLPSIIDNFPEGVTDFEQVSGEDQYTIFKAVQALIRIGVSDTELFRVRKPE